MVIPSKVSNLGVYAIPIRFQCGYMNVLISLMFLNLPYRESWNRHIIPPLSVGYNLVI